jgi:hypothetical protein
MLLKNIMNKDLLFQGDDNLMKAVENELNKSIKRHLESGEFNFQSSPHPQEDHNVLLFAFGIFLY